MQFLQFDSEDTLEKVLQQSSSKPQFIFKHSTACPISKIVYDRMLSFLSEFQAEGQVYYVGVIEERGMSNLIEKQTGVKHESPQLIVIKDAKVIYHESHLLIQPREVLNRIKDIL